MLDYKSFLGNEYEVTIDRPIGTVHPKHPNIIYPINYGYIEGFMAEDDEDKLVAVCGDKEFSDEEIDMLTNFQEQYYKHKIIRQ